MWQKSDSVGQSLFNITGKTATHNNLREILLIVGNVQSISESLTEVSQACNGMLFLFLHKSGEISAN